MAAQKTNTKLAQSECVLLPDSEMVWGHIDVSDTPHGCHFIPEFETPILDVLRATIINITWAKGQVAEYQSVAVLYPAELRQTATLQMEEMTNEQLVL